MVTTDYQSRSNNPTCKYNIWPTINNFRGQTFDQVDNAFCRLVNDANNQNYKYTLNEKGQYTSIIMAVVQRDGSGWTMQLWRGRKWKNSKGHGPIRHQTSVELLSELFL